MYKKNLSITAVIIILLFSFSIPVSAGEAKPIQLSLFSPVQLVPADQPVAGVRLSLFYGKNTSVVGLDWGLVNHNTAGLSKGVQIGLVGIIEADFVGFQHNFINSVGGNCEGFQWGFINHAQNMNGFQLGFINHAGTMKGLQIGLINVIKQGGQFPVFPIVNWSF